MNDFLTFLNFYVFFKNSESRTAIEIGRMLELDEETTMMHKKKALIVDNIVEMICEEPECDASYLTDRAGMSQEDLQYYITAIQSFYPGLIRMRHIDGCRLAGELCIRKKESAISFLTGTGMADELISEKTGLDQSQIDAARKHLPVIKKQNTIVQRFRLESQVRDFFRLHPYSTIKDAARHLNTTAHVLRGLVEEMRMNGEDIKFNNVPVKLEKEEIRHKVLELKKQEPAITNSEISLRLNIPATEVQSAIQDTIKIYQSERADAYFFFLDKTSGDLETIKKEALKRHEGSEKSSSRWLEIMLIAIEKQIAIHGLKAPERLDIRQEVRVTKEERDKIIEAAMASDALDVDFKKVEVTGR